MSRLSLVCIMGVSLACVCALGLSASAEETRPAPEETRPAPEEAKPAAPPALKVGQLAPTFLLKSLNPNKGGIPMFSTKKVMGAKARDRRRAVVLSFGASYCAPCKKEIPELQKIADRYRDKGVLVVEVIVDKEPEGVEAMRKFTVDELALSFPVLHDRFGIVGRKYGAVQLPHLVVLDGDKVVRWIHSGFTPDGMKQLRKALDAVLAAAPEKSPEGKQDKP